MAAAASTGVVVDFMVAGVVASTAVADTGNLPATQHNKACSSERAFVFWLPEWTAGRDRPTVQPYLPYCQQSGLTNHRL